MVPDLQRQRIAERDGFIRSSATALSASFLGVHNTVERAPVIDRGIKLAEKMWTTIEPFKSEMTGEEWASFKVDVVAFAANMMAHSREMSDEALLVFGVDCAQIKWKRFQEWREQNDEKA